MSGPEPAAAAAESAPFGRRARWLIVAAAAALGVTLFFYVFGEAPEAVSSAGADTFSRSAIGFHALVAFLRDSGRAVRVSRFAPLSAVGPDAGLLLLAPPASDPQGGALGSMVAAAVRRGAPVVVVLPEWQPRPDEDHPGWIAAATPVPAERVGRMLAKVVGTSSPPPAPRRLGGTITEGFRGPLATGLAPALPNPQLLPGGLPGFEPLLATGGGWVAAVDRRRGITLVSDPDLLDTYGLGRGDNALVAHRLFVEGGAGGRAPAVWIVDETLHGFERVPSLVHELIEPPLVLFTLQAGVLAALAVWAAVRRFGKAALPPPGLPAGARTLIENTARLLDLGGHHAAAVERYLESVLSDAGAAFGLPPALDRAERVTRLAAVARSRGATEDLEDIGRAVAALRESAPGQAGAARAFDLARRAWSWREEALDGAR